MEDENKEQINTVHENDLRSVLLKLGLKEKIEKKEIKCKFCKTEISLENIYSFLPESGSVNIICDNPNCITELMKYLSEKDKTKSEI